MITLNWPSSLWMRLGDRQCQAWCMGIQTKLCFLVTLSSPRDSLSILHLKESKLASSICPVYCHLCTRSYSVGDETQSHKKLRFLPIWKRWGKGFPYVEKVQDVVSQAETDSISNQKRLSESERLVSIPYMMRLRLASKGLAVLSEFDWGPFSSPG